MATYTDFTSGNFSLNDVIAGSPWGFTPADYQGIANTFGFSDETGAPSEYGMMDSLATTNPYYTEGSKIFTQESGFTPEYQSLLDRLSLNNSWDGDGNRTWKVTDPQNKDKSWSSVFAPPSTLDKVIGTMAPALVGGAFGGGLAGLFGGGFTGGALGQGLAGGVMSSAQGGSFGKGFLGGAIGGGLQGMAAGTPAVIGNNPSAYIPGTPGTSLAGMAGITNPTIGGMFNRGVGGALGTLAAGGSGSDALKSGLTGGAVAGLNSLGGKAMDFMGDAFKTLSTPEQAYSSNPAENASYPAGGYMPNGSMALQQAGIGPEMSYAPPGSAGDTNGSFLNSILADSQPTTPPTQKTPQNVDPGNVTSFGNIGSSIGNFIGGHAGDLASMLYGFYNNRKQQQALGSQLSGLQGLYSQNSPYAAQLRNQLAAKAAATGHRTNIAGRETQLQAMLADRAASMMPAQYQIQQGQNALKNNNMNMLLQGFNKLGGFNAIGSGLQNMFRNPGSLTGPGSYDAYKNMDDMYGTVG